MNAKTKIEWTQTTWNPVTGCSKISLGCKNCYAERMAHRLKAMGIDLYSKDFEVVMHPECLDKPLRLKKSRMIFVNSMSDLFHEKVSDNFIFQAFEVMRKANWHVFQVLTKRSKRLKEMSKKMSWADNIWMGVTVESGKYVGRIDDLKKTDAKIKFISFEPLLSNILNLDLRGIDWAIVGGESGPKSRIIKEDWVTNIRDSCQKYKIPFFFKQWGGYNKKKAGRVLEDKTWDEMPGYGKSESNAINLPNSFSSIG